MVKTITMSTISNDSTPACKKACIGAEKAALATCSGDSKRIEEEEEILKAEALKKLDELLGCCEKVLSLCKEPSKKTEFAGFLDGASRQFKRFLHQQVQHPRAEDVPKDEAQKEEEDKEKPTEQDALPAAAPIVKLPKRPDYTFKTIGYIKTPFVELNGTPRQAALALGCPGELKLKQEVQPSSSLRDLEGYSHLWVISVFHANTNMSFHGTVSPPLLEGKKTGVFATRSPHRPNPIALSLCKIESVDVKKGVVRLLGVDLVNGTPILDIKPFVKADVLTEAKWPAWLDNPRLSNVVWTEEARKQLREAVEKRKSCLRVLRSPEEAEKAVDDALKLDVRTTHARKKHDEKVYGMYMDGLNFVFEVDDDTRTCKVFKVHPWK